MQELEKLEEKKAEGVDMLGLQLQKVLKLVHTNQALCKLEDEFLDAHLMGVNIGDIATSVKGTRPRLMLQNIASFLNMCFSTNILHTENTVSK